MRNQTKHSKGFTLLEILVGLSLSVVVLGGVIAVYVPSVQTWRTTDQLGEIHDKETTLRDLFTDNIRSAGIIQCDPNKVIANGLDPSNDQSLVDGWAFLPDSFLKNSFGALAANNATDLSGNYGIPTHIAGDAFHTLAPAKGYYRLSEHTAGADDKTLVLTPATAIFEGALYLINDCVNPVLVMAQSTDATNSKLSYTNTVYNDILHFDNTVVNAFSPSLFYIDNFDANDDGNAIPTLFQRTIDNVAPGDAFTTTSIPVVTGVDNLRIEYGIATPSGSFVDNYFTIVNFPSTNSMSDVKVVRLTVMIRSSQTNGTNAASSLLFPDLNGDLKNCLASGTIDAFACPSHVTAEPDIARKVITFTLLLPSETAI
ncbi:MAG: type IV pilus assembly protein PilW [Saprospiraceae bacterium]|jgi:type IV pilus assembly protein PilW